jgi:hypothetical protein
METTKNILTWNGHVRLKVTCWTKLKQKYQKNYLVELKLGSYFSQV